MLAYDRFIPQAGPLYCLCASGVCARSFIDVGLVNPSALHTDLIVLKRWSGFAVGPRTAGSKGPPLAHGLGHLRMLASPWSFPCRLPSTFMP